MKLNKFVVALGLGMTLISGAVFAAEAPVDQGHGSVTFQGSIISSPCSIRADEADQTVRMGQINNKILAAGGKSSPELFDIKLHDCIVTDTDNSVSITFAGTESAATDGNLALTGGTAKNASIAITDDVGEVIKIGEKTSLKDLLDGENTLTFAAYLQGDGGSSTVVPGNFNTTATFQLAYD